MTAAPPTAGDRDSAASSDSSAVSGDGGVPVTMRVDEPFVS